MAPPHTAAWQNPRIFLSLLLVFLCGVGVGTLGMSLGVHRWIHQSQAAWREGDKEVSLERFRKELDLTPTQAEQLSTVLDDFFMYYHTLQAQLDEVRANGKNRILRILNEDQKKKFNRMMSELQAKQLK